jgi:superfamily I DNA/RNA helicase
MSGTGIDIDDVIEGSTKTEADDLYQRYQVYRNLLRAPSFWESEVVGFANQWEAWKQETGYIDFTDMIEIAYDEIDIAPGNPIIGFFDEAQDFTPLELKLIRKWGEEMKFIVLAGDDDQSIYGFKGATPDAFLDPPLDEKFKRVLEQSYRVPSSVHTVAETWIHQLSRRETKKYKPRNFEGSFRKLTDSHEYGGLAPTFEKPERFLEDMLKYINQTDEDGTPKTIMFLGTCSYMLDELKFLLRSQAYPFHNPFRRKRGDWNPLNPGKGKSAGQRLAAFSAIDRESGTVWTPDQFTLWMEHVSKTLFQKDVREKLKKMPEQFKPMTYAQLESVFKNVDSIVRAADDGLEWFYDQVIDSKKKSYDYPSAIAERRGIDALTREPQIILGTIHSVKGGQADVVYLMPDLSGPGFHQWMTPSSRDHIYRQMYVGMTRAKETLCIAKNASRQTVRGIGE